MGLIREQSEAISARAGELIDEALEEIEGEPQKRKWLMQLNAARGTSVDKILASPVDVNYNHNIRLLQYLISLTDEKLYDLANRGKSLEPPEMDGYRRRS